MAVDALQDVAGYKEVWRRAKRIDVVYYDTGDIVGDTHSLAQTCIVPIQISDAELGVTMVLSVFCIFKKVLDDRQRYAVSDIVARHKALKGHSYDLVIKEDGATRIAGVDGCIDLHDQMLITAAVRIYAEIDP